MMGSALALRRLLRDLGAWVALCGAALGGLLALAWLAGRHARPPWAVLLGTAAGIALGLPLVWPSNRTRVWRGLRAVGETLCSLAVVLGLWVGTPLAVWARHHFRSDARRGDVRGVDRTAPQDESLPRLREARGEGDCLVSTKAQGETFAGVSRIAMEAPGGHGGRGLPVHESAEASLGGGAHGTCKVTERAG